MKAQRINYGQTTLEIGPHVVIKTKAAFGLLKRSSNRNSVCVTARQSDDFMSPTSIFGKSRHETCRSTFETPGTFEGPVGQTRSRQVVGYSNTMNTFKERLPTIVKYPHIKRLSPLSVAFQNIYIVGQHGTTKQFFLRITKPLGWEKECITIH